MDDTIKIKRPKILYVEDDRGLATLYRTRMVQEGFEVLHCPDGDSALQQGRGFRPDLILLDIMMPTLSGFDAIEMFRGLPETSAAIIVVMSAMSQSQDIEKAKQLGADDYLVKSQVLIEDVIIRLRDLLTAQGFDLSAISGPAEV